MSKFNVGDRVRILSSKYNHIEWVKEMIGEVFRIYKVLDGNDYEILTPDETDSYVFNENELEPQPKNLIPLIARELGVEIGEWFNIKGANYNPHRFTEYGLVDKDKDLRVNLLNDFIYGRGELEKLPPKPKLTEAERVILENLPKEYKYIGRLENYGLVLYTIKPIKTETGVFDNGYANFGLYSKLFQFIKWKDEEPYNIEELLEEYENYNK